MVKIIKKSEVPYYATTCPICGCRFVYQEADTSYGYVDCPMDGCKESINLRYKFEYATLDDLDKLGEALE